ncbi:MAG: 16S rRNA (uracil(1498)-N(3))-methyltransferase, partial [Deltaproteobacteria bacterium]
AGGDPRSLLRPPARPRGLVRGPEGGLSPAEIALVVARGGVLARAPLPVLRVETAACVLTALAALASAPEPGESAQDDAGPHLR